MGKELIFKTLRHEKTDDIPWVPFAGVHAGKLKGYTAQELLTDEDKLVESLLEVHKLYMPDGMPIMFDLQVEAEIIGCELKWAKDNPPSVKSHPWEGPNKEIPCACKIPNEKSGRIPIFGFIFLAVISRALIKLAVILLVTNSLLISVQPPRPLFSAESHCFKILVV